MKNKYLTVLSTAIIGIFIDQLSKLWINTNLQLNQTIPIIQNVFHLTYILNSGAGFGILQQQKLLLILISIIVIGAIFYYIRKIKAKEKILQILVGFILGGTIGNLIDRVSYGYVIDFLDFRIWPIFNFADTYTSIGAILLAIIIFREERINKSTHIKNKKMQ